MGVFTYFLAFLAAIANATSSVLQRKANRDEPGEENMSLRLIWGLLHRPVWFAGILAVIAGFLLQATALGNGQLAVVEPILVLELPATLIGAAIVFNSQLRRLEWSSAVAMTAGLVALLYFLSPKGGNAHHTSALTWGIGIGATLAAIGVAVLFGLHDPVGSRRASALGVATGCGFGLTAALMKGMTNQYARGFGALFTSWELYGMIVAGALSMFLLQSAMNAGRLLAAQPGITLSDPVVSILWGILAFHEHTRGGLFLVLAILSGALLVGAVLVLSQSPLLDHEEGEDEGGAENRDRAAGGRDYPSDESDRSSVEEARA